MSKTYVICGCKSWNKSVFDEIISKFDGEWIYFGSKEELTNENLDKINPDRIFFLHWSWIVPDEILSKYECINFHMTDVPYGRGGSPLQNLIVRGHKETKLSALKMTSELDAGPVYLKEQMPLDGTAQEILERSSQLAGKMIEKINSDNPEPKEQDGEPTIFERRKPDQSEIPDGLSIEELYDYIRMLDGEGYPPAFVKKRGFRYEYTSAM
ncbi:TPA: methionyl-tRNA formyltransferase, partial [Candidatus Peribacteria bacterium]|nr:methionyl-tRNA formyltransferase [Candidatus Peribacteria bacterium]